MNFKKSSLYAVVFLFSLSASLFAQRATPTPNPRSDMQSEQQPGSYYRLDFAVLVIEGGKTTNTRNYSLWTQAGEGNDSRAASDIRAINEVPYTSNQIQYRSVGTQFFCTLKELEGKIRISMTAEISEVVPPEKDQDAKAPVFHSISAKATTLLELEKPTIVSSIDDSISKRRFQIEVTATKLK
jgi:hypothetical protein